MKSYQARQGDIFFRTVENPVGEKKLASPIIAYGEITGHCHKISSPAISELDSVVDQNGDIFVRNMNGPISIDHDEHGTVTLPQGEWFSITRQREYDAAAAKRERQVQD